MEVQRVWIRHLELISEPMAKMNVTVSQTKHQPAREPSVTIIRTRGLQKGCKKKNKYKVILLSYVVILIIRKFSFFSEDSPSRHSPSLPA